MNVDRERIEAITEGAIWDRRSGGHEPAVKIVRTVRGRIGVRLLVQGLHTGRLWAVSLSTLLANYDPRTLKTSPDSET